MKKYFILCCSMFGLAFTTPVLAGSNYVTIEEINGTQTSYLLSEEPIITYSNDSLIVSGSINASYPLSQVDNYHFTDTDKSEVPTIKSNEVRISYTDNQHVKVEGLGSNASINLYNANGSQIVSTNSLEDGSIEITLPQTKGIYLLKTNTHTYKFVKE